MITWVNFILGFMIFLESSLGLSIPLSSIQQENMQTLAWEITQANTTYELSSDLDQQIGQLFIIGLSGSQLTPDEKQFIEQYLPGGILLFSRNISTVQQTKKLITEIKNCYPENYLPPFIAIDEEGGIVSRLPDPYHITPSAKSLGENYSKYEVKKYASSLGLVLQDIGFNLDFAPVLDINSNINNPIVGSRAFSNEPIKAYEYGKSFSQGLNAQHILTTMKHFPGHGDTSVDSHYQMPTLNKSIDDMIKSDLKPFLMAIEDQTEAIMVGHLLWKEKDPEYPASLSKKIINDYLRNDLNYQGLVFTDDLEMGAVSSSYKVADRSVLAFYAGNDMLLMVHSLEAQETGIKAILATANAESFTKRLSESTERIKNYKNRQLRPYLIPEKNVIDQWFEERVK